MSPLPLNRIYEVTLELLLYIELIVVTLPWDAIINKNNIIIMFWNWLKRKLTVLVLVLKYTFLELNVSVEINYSNYKPGEGWRYARAWMEMRGIMVGWTRNCASSLCSNLRVNFAERNALFQPCVGRCTRTYLEDS